MNRMALEEKVPRAHDADRDGEKGAAPVKAWRRYNQVWRSEA